MFARGSRTVYDRNLDRRLRQFELRRPLTSETWPERLVAEFLAGRGDAPCAALSTDDRTCATQYAMHAAAVDDARKCFSERARL
jgi:hypothetical protein